MNSSDISHIENSLQELSISEPDNKIVPLFEGKLCCQVISAHEGDEKDFDNLQHFNPKKYHFFFGNLSNIACLHSHTKCLIYAIEKGFPFCRKTLQYCAQSGSEQCFIECLQRGIEFYQDVYLWSIEHSQIDFIHFLLNNNFPPHPFSLKKAFLIGRLDILTLLFESGLFFMDDEIIEIAIISNNQDLKLFVCYNLDSNFCSQLLAEKLSAQIQNLFDISSINLD